MTLTVDSIVTRIKAYEEEIQKLVTNHISLTGALAELKGLLTLATPVVDAVVPEAAPALEVVNAVVDDVSPEETATPSTN